MRKTIPLFAFFIISTILLVSSSSGSSFLSAVDATAFIKPYGVTTDSNDRIIVSDIGTDLIQVYDSFGNSIFEMDGTGINNQGTTFIDVFAVTTDANDRIITTDATLNLIQVYDSFGNFIFDFNGTGTNGGGRTFMFPSALATDSDDKIFVLDNHYKFDVEHNVELSIKTIQIYDSSGNFIFDMDGTGTNNQGTAFTYPSALAIDSNDRLIVADSATHILQIYDSSGNFIFDMDGTGTDGTGTTFENPFGLITDSNDRIILADYFELPHILQVYDSSGKFEFEFNGTGTNGDGSLFGSGYEIAIDSNDRLIVVDTLYQNIHVYDSSGNFIFTFYDYDFSILPDDSDSGSNANKHLTKPTFGIDHKTHIQKITGGFTFNDKSFDITYNFWTPFEQQAIRIGETNTFSAKVFAEQKLKVQEFLFGIPRVGDAHLAELRVEVFYDYTGEIEKIQAIQKTNIIEKDSLVVETYPSNCLPDETEQKCVTTTISMKFLEPLRDSVMAIKANDHKNRTITTYLNDGFDISGDSLNPMITKQIPGPVKYEGLITVTQFAKYSDVWIANDGRVFERNDSGTFTLINESFERLIDTYEIKNRTHSEFYTLVNYEINRAAQIMTEQLCSHCYDEPYAEINDIFAYEHPILIPKSEDIRIQAALIAEELKAQQILYEK